ncbi:MAG: histone deacetylase family protein [Promethearchaeota archaeon]
MKIIFHEKFFEEYTTDPAAEAGRLEPTYFLLKKDDFYEFIEPQPATKEDILRAHTHEHYERIKRNEKVFEVALLAAGGAISAAELAYKGEPTFALIRPPGHHASSDDCWGFCFFNNMSIALLNLKTKHSGLKNVFLLDFDLHTGDGNINILSSHPELNVEIFNPHSASEADYLSRVRDRFEKLKDIDLICASAGFDNAIGDWGGTLSTDAYAELGRLMREYSLKLCKGCRFAILEGGYNFDLMAKNIDAFCKEFGKK